MLHRYIRKGRLLTDVHYDEIAIAEHKINNTPRKILGFKKPIEFFNDEIRYLTLRRFSTPGAAEPYPLEGMGVIPTNLSHFELDFTKRYENASHEAVVEPILFKKAQQLFNKSGMSKSRKGFGLYLS